ncbi:Uu.00g123830.m01.CDS01 [Anthostomella pinea]|uniref:Uu.00g123830.m01.CDS01 n=1 Tax=Anthostomella pinea TaxID=933095 RepID=A0AAI8VIH6_9PEZI|nr:Uu.00g123830.m01.CDS01 [Anthostomella pinea]
MKNDMDHTDPVNATTPLNPGMVAAPPSESYYSDAHDDSSTDKEYSVHVASLLRAVIIILTLTNAILQIKDEPEWPVTIILMVLTWLSLTWNISSVVPGLVLVGGKKVGMVLPQTSLVVGGRTYVLFGPSEDDTDKDGRRAVLRTAVADLLLGGHFLLFSLIGELGQTVNWWRHETAIMVLCFIVTALQLVVGAFMLFPALTQTRFVIRSVYRRDAGQYHIRLPQDIEAAPVPSRQPISITA